MRGHQKQRGLLIAFEGPDGSGKSTQRKLFKMWLKSEGHYVASTKWNSSPTVKPIIKMRKEERSLDPVDFCLLHAADYRWRMTYEVLPALERGALVIADRHVFTALARDTSRGLDPQRVLRAYEPVIWPDLVFYFSVSPEVSLQRIAATRAPKYYEAGQDVTGIADPYESYRQFMTRVIGEYKAMAEIFGFVTVDAEQSLYQQHRLIRRLFLERLPNLQSLPEAIPVAA
ncbi:MAG: dTMP kinase [Acidobacteriota bacterium]